MSGGVVLDTHAWVWWVTRPDRLTRPQRAAIDRVVAARRNPVLISIISCWEVALLVAHRRFRFTVPSEVWLEQATGMPGIEIVALSLPIIVTASRLTTLRDPADMLIVATAQHHGVRLVTSDARIEQSGAVGVVS